MALGEAMDWFSLDLETREVTKIDEPRTLSMLSKYTAHAIRRWLQSGMDAPDYRSTDGVSEVEAAMYFPIN